MWIQTQNKQRIINADQIVDIFIDRTGTKIFAETAIDRDNSNFVPLGEYKDRDTCLKILEHIFVMGFAVGVPAIEMPLGGEIDKWESDLAEIATNYIMSKKH